MNRFIIFIIYLFGLYSLFFISSCNKKNENEKSISNPQFHVGKTMVFGEKTSNGRFFGEISGISVSDSSGNVYILDSEFKQIFVYDSLGNYLKTISGGYGRGPGEFEFPRDISVDKNEKLYVYDYNLRRVTLFDITGKVINTILVNISSKSILVANNKIWFSNLASKKYKVASRGLIEDTLRYFIPVNNRDISFSPSGSVASLGIINGNELIVASTVPGIWYKEIDDTFKEFGKDLLAGREAVITKDNIPVEPGGTMGIGMLFEDKVGIVWRELILEKDFPTLGPFRLEIFEENGTHIETIELPMKWANDVFFDQNNNIYFAVDEPFPSVEKYTVQKIKLQ